MKRDLTFEEYRELPGVNFSCLKNYGRSPAHYKHALEHPVPTTAAMLTGAALHSLALEGEMEFRRRYVVAPAEIDRRTKAGKEAWTQFEQEAAGKDILTADQHDAVLGMTAAILAHPRAGNLLERCRDRELSLSWTDFATALGCKARLDGWAEKEGLVVDIKTTDDASPESFGRSAYKFQYHGQSAFYLDGLQSAGGHAERFLFIVVEKAPPHGVAVYLASEEMLESGRLLVQSYLAQHAECLAAGSWPGYPVEVQPLSLPPWARMAI